MFIVNSSTKHPIFAIGSNHLVLIHVKLGCQEDLPDGKYLSWMSMTTEFDIMLRSMMSIPSDKEICLTSRAWAWLEMEYCHSSEIRGFRRAQTSYFWRVVIDTKLNSMAFSKSPCHLGLMSQTWAWRQIQYLLRSSSGCCCQENFLGTLNWNQAKPDELVHSLWEYFNVLKEKSFSNTLLGWINIQLWVHTLKKFLCMYLWPHFLRVYFLKDIE